MNRSISVYTTWPDGESQRDCSANSSAYLAVRCRLIFRHCVGQRKCNLGSQAPRHWITSFRRRRKTSAMWSKDEGESGPTGEAETIDLGNAEEVGSASTGQVVQWGRRWPPNARRDRGGMHGFRLDTATDGRQKKKKHCVRQQLCCVDRDRLSELFCCCVDVPVIASW